MDLGDLGAVCVRDWAKARLEEMAVDLGDLGAVCVRDWAKARLEEVAVDLGDLWGGMCKGLGQSTTGGDGRGLGRPPGRYV